MTTPTPIAFGAFPPWEQSLRRNLAPRYAPTFLDLDLARPRDLAAFAAIIPIQLRHYTPLARHPQLRGSKFFTPSPAVTSLCDDKLSLTHFLISEGFAAHVPPLRSPGPPYPYVLKKRHSWWGQDCHIIHGPQQDPRPEPDPDWFAQTFIPGELEFATHILRTGGQIRYASTFAHKMPSAVSINGAQASPIHSTFLRGCPHLDLFSQILTRLDFEGTACIDYKIAAGQPLIFEINPRFGGSLCSDITAYLDAYLAALTPTTHSPSLLAHLLARLK